MQQHLELARKIAYEAGDLTLRYFYDPDHVPVERKADESPVTLADREAETLLRRRIEEQFPNDAILGEEFPVREGTSGFRWLLDPIDGTKSFIHGVPLYSTLIGLERDGVSIGGVIAVPALSELVWAGRGLGAWHEAKRFGNPVPAHVSRCQTISEALFLTSEVLTFDHSDRQDAYKRLEGRVRLTRTWGDAYGYFLVATGRAEIMVDPLLSDWDAGPLLVILEEAGGQFTDWKGNATVFGKEGVGTNGVLHNNVLQILNRE
ncbi:MAG: histidinol-phosphatase [Planctomycetaceae bacterium]|jgi:histidinol phosphatase-like enzyme (inositol monophosphatase family)|nr:histidinol-phosphatase [Planctomycetaceae bacterium]